MSCEAQFMHPSLISLCIQAIKDAILDDLFDQIIPILPPLALQNLQNAMPSVSYNDGSFSSRNQRSFENLDIAWKTLYDLRWPVDQKLSVDSLSNTNWHQIYWEKHLQNCLDTTVETVPFTLSDGYLGNVILPDYLLEYISHEGHISKSRSYSTLTYNCERFGPYARCLRLRGVHCLADIVYLLRKCRLEYLEINSFNSSKQVEGLCKLLEQNTKTLKSLGFNYCKLPASLVSGIYNLLDVKGLKTNVIRNLSIKRSIVLDNSDFRLASLHFKSLLSATSGLTSLVLSDNKMCFKTAISVFDTLLETESRLQILDLSGNYISGWLSHFKRTAPSWINSYRQVNNSLKFLRVLNLRSNNLQKHDVDCLKYTMSYMPILEVLNLSDNFLQDDGISMLFPYLVEKSRCVTPLTELYVENCGLTCDGASQLFDVLATLKVPLKSFSIADNSLTRGIELGTLGFSFARGETITSKKLSLVCIDISDNNGEHGTLRFLSAMILRAPKLVSVDAARNNWITTDLLTCICSFLKAANGKLEHLDLRCNPLRQTSDVVSLLAEYQINGKPNILLSPP